MARAPIVSHCLAIALLSVGCQSHYTTPGSAADMRAFGITPPDEREKLTDYKIKQELDRKPLATFPANICMARVQGSQCQSYGRYGYGHGAYSVVTTREVETDDLFKKIAGLPMVAGVATVNRMLLPEDLKSDMQLRQAAAKLHAQVLLLYTFDTRFYGLDRTSPVNVLTFGFGNHKDVRINVTASAALLDVRNGYVYGVAEATASREQSTNSWDNEKQADQSHREAEAEALGKLTDELALTWQGIVETYAKPAEVSTAE